MKSTTTVVGVDIAKRVVQLHRVESNTGEFKGLARTRAQLFDPVAHRAPCRMAIEACEGAPHWGRPPRSLGHQVRLRSAKQIWLFIRGHANDAQEARAIGTGAHRRRYVYFFTRGKGDDHR